MIILTCIVILLSLFASSVMMYIALATSIGPWVGPLLLLLIPPLFKFFFTPATIFNQVAAVIGGSIGGILATACAFSLPAIYFVDSVFYNQWLATPVYFVGAVSLLCFLSGAFGILCANQYEMRFDIVKQGVFPSAQLIFSMLQSADQYAQRVKLLCGALLYTGFLFVQKLFLCLFQLTRFYFFMNSLTIVPMLISIGFVTGHVIAFPLFVGVLMRFICVDVIRLYWFNVCTPLNFSLAFCTGIIMQSIFVSFYKPVRFLFSKNMQQDLCALFKAIKMFNYHHCGIFLSLAFISLGAYYYCFSIFFILYAIFTTMVAVYFMVILAAKTGLAYLGRFATFVMVPAMMIFKCSWLQLIVLSTFVEIAGGVAVDVLSGRKIVQLAGLHDNRFVVIQWIGLLVASVATGFVLWGLCTYLQLGSSELAGYKAHARALLLNLNSFEIVPVILGFCAGAFCSLLQINTGTLLGGILMPLETAIGLIMGGTISFFVKNKDFWYPLASGVFAANSLYMIIKAFLYHGN